jgi:hypothetical protein
MLTHHTKLMMIVKVTQAVSSLLARRSSHQLIYKTKIPSKSSTKTEVIGLYNKSGDILWTRHFLKAQGYTISSNIVFQDNMSTLSLAKHGYASSSKRTKHIKAKYLYIKHHHASGE